MFIAVEFHITNAEKEELIENEDAVADKADLRDKLTQINRKRKSTMAEQNQDSYERLAKEMQNLREELHTLRQEVVQSGAADSNETAFGFDKNEFLAMSATKSLQWVTTTLAPKVKQECSKYPSYFGALRAMAMPSEMVVWTCAGFNRGTQCKSKWHVYERPNRSSSDIRLHCCTLCYDALGVLSEHKMIDCPWLKESTWIEIRGVKPEERDDE